MTERTYTLSNGETLTESALDARIEAIRARLVNVHAVAEWERQSVHSENQRRLRVITKLEQAREEN